MQTACEVYGASHLDSWIIYTRHWRDARACLGSGSVLHKAPNSWWVMCPIFFYRLVGICAYARMVSKGGTYRPVCAQLILRIWIPRMLRVGKVAVKVGLKWPSSAGLMLQDLAHLALWFQVQDKSRPRYGQTSKSVCLFCAAAWSPPSPTTCPPNRTSTPANTMVKASSLQSRPI